MLTLLKHLLLSGFTSTLCSFLLFLPKGQFQSNPIIHAPSMSANSVWMAESKPKTMSEHKKSPMRIVCYLQERVEILDLAGPLEVFAYAGWEVFIVGKTKTPIHAQGILQVTPQYDLTDAPEADILAFFGGNSQIAVGDKALIDWVKVRGRDAKLLFSVCTGARMLGKAGFLDQKQVTTYHGVLDQLQSEVPQAKVLSGVRWVDHGNVITTAGISAGIDGALHLVARLEGEKVANRIAREMEYDYWDPASGLVVEE